MLNAHKIKKDFPIFKRKINGKDLVYLDSAASTQKPQSVIDAITDFYSNHYSNIHRGVYQLSQEATEKYEESHIKVAKFLSCSEEEVIFTKNATDSLNIAAFSLSNTHLVKNDDILLTQLEHHSNIVPWQIISQQKTCNLKYAAIQKDGTVDLEDFKRKLTKKTKIVSFTMMSNALGTLTEYKEMAAIAKENGSIVIIDGAQGVPHYGFDAKKIKCDFLAFSSHKMLGPTGIGVLFGKKEILEEIEPYQFGGDMIREVTFEKSTWNDIPWKFEAGTANIADGIAFSSAIDYINKLGMDEIIHHDEQLTKYAYAQLCALKGITVYGPEPNKRGSVISFNIKGVHAHDVGSLLDDDGICVRGGHHCVMPLMSVLGVSGTARASFYVYNSQEDVDLLVDGIKKVQKVFA